MAIRFECESCGKSLAVKDELAGRKIRCPGCQTAVVIPDESDEPAVEPTRKRGGGRRRESRPAESQSPWYVSHWQWFVVVAVLLLALIPKQGAIIAIMVACVGVILVLVGGVMPFFRIMAGDSQTALRMAFSPAARLEMMNMPDSHPYKQLVRSAFGATRGLAWRGLLLVITFFPAEQINSRAQAWFPHQPRNRPDQNLAQQVQFGEVADGQQQQQTPPNQPPLPHQPFSPDPQTIPGAFGAGAVQAPLASGNDRIVYVKMVFQSHPGNGSPSESLKTSLAEFPGFVADGFKYDEASKTAQFQHRGPFDIPQAIAVLNRLKLVVTSVSTSEGRPDDFGS